MKLKRKRKFLCRLVAFSKCLLCCDPCCDPDLDAGQLTSFWFHPFFINYLSSSTLSFFYNVAAMRKSSDIPTR